ncbi:MAG: hypothetical protein ABSC03_13280 [Verrucomicrobiota bacterium]|jgi:hypothetical protein
MGHERVGVLPKTKPWKGVVTQITSFSGTEVDASAIASTTLTNVRSRFESIQHDSGVKAAFKFFVALSVSASSQFSKDVTPYGLRLSSKPSPFALAKLLQEWVNNNCDSLEYAQLAQGAASDAIANWYSDKSSQKWLFQSENEQTEVWREAATAAGFCELSRLFFAKFTERYLNYFLERQASVSCPTIEQRDLLEEQIRKQVDAISKHAFETAKITQSFAAGWYNLHTKEGLPSDQEVEAFLTIAFGKIREELRREGEE